MHTHPSVATILRVRATDCGRECDCSEKLGSHGNRASRATHGLEDPPLRTLVFCLRLGAAQLGAVWTRKFKKLRNGPDDRDTSTDIAVHRFDRRQGGRLDCIRDARPATHGPTSRGAQNPDFVSRRELRIYVRNPIAMVRPIGSDARPHAATHGDRSGTAVILMALMQYTAQESPGHVRPLVMRRESGCPPSAGSRRHQRPAQQFEFCTLVVRRQPRNVLSHPRPNMSERGTGPKRTREPSRNVDYDTDRQPMTRRDKS
ncbi:hypothetical protein B0H17DRAFT_1249298 [Mycena rosella]|uniref:Uncharacterized protein n=1 Tax=Mycena rosella TaxID=1033263 RepID=A0AAD7MBR7_MYCRO|nr:hypothetical protein B0H17DRAFT_1249298 [Mycena rosella]